MMAASWEDQEALRETADHMTFRLRRWRFIFSQYGYPIFFYTPFSFFLVLVTHVTDSLLS